MSTARSAIVPAAPGTGSVGARSVNSGLPVRGVARVDGTDGAGCQVLGRDDGAAPLRVEGAGVESTRGVELAPELEDGVGGAVERRGVR